MDKKKPNQNKSINNDTEEITIKDIISLLSLNKIPLKDINYAKDHTTIEKVNIKHEYEIIVKDIDNQIHHLKLELKIYK